MRIGIGAYENDEANNSIYDNHIFYTCSVSKWNDMKFVRWQRKRREENNNNIVYIKIFWTTCWTRPHSHITFPSNRRSSVHSIVVMENWRMQYILKYFNLFTLNEIAKKNATHSNPCECNVFSKCYRNRSIETNFFLHKSNKVFRKSLTKF